MYFFLIFFYTAAENFPPKKPFQKRYGTNVNVELNALVCLDFVVQLFRLLRSHRRCRELFALASIARQIREVEEAREEDEVAGVHGDGELDVGRRDVAGGVTGLLKEAMRPDVDGTADDHLRQLQGCDDHRDEAGRAELQRTEGVVGVHQRVHAVVHDHEPAGRGGVLGVGEPRVHEDGDVVVPVEEDQRLFAQHDEDGVAELGKL